MSNLNTFRIFNSVFIVAIFPSCPLSYPVQCCNADSVEEWIFIEQIVNTYVCETVYLFDSAILSLKTLNKLPQGQANSLSKLGI